MTAVDGCEALGRHRAFKLDPAQWAKLEFVGVQDDFAGGLMELVNCPFCHSTLSRYIHRETVR